MADRAAEELSFRLPTASPEELRTRMGAAELRRHLSALQNLTGAALAHLTLPELLRELLERLRQELSVDTATVLLGTPGGQTLAVRASVGLEEEVEQRVEIPLGQGIAGTVAARRQAVIVDEVARVSTASPLLQRLASMMVAPLVAQGEMLGILHVGVLEPRTFADTELYLLQVVADRLGPAIQHALLYERSQAEVRARQATEARLAERNDMFQLLAETAADAIVTMDANGTIVSANPAAAEVFGYPIKELVGMAMVELIPERYREAHRAGVDRYIRTGARHIPWRGLELPGLHRSGREIPLEIAFAERARGGRRFFTGTMRDITERKRTERLLAVQFAVTRVLAEAVSVEEAVPRLLRVVGEVLGWDMGVFWQWDPPAGLLRSAGLWTSSRLQGCDFEGLTRSMTFEPGVGLPGRVQAAAQPAWIVDVTRDGNFPRLEAAARAGLHGAFAFPICVGEDCVGVMEFFSREVSEPDPQLLSTMDALGTDIGQFIRRRHAEERLQEQEETQRFLARTSTALSAAALDYDATLGVLARQAVSALADWCVVYVRQDGGEIERLELVHADPARADLSRDLARHPFRATPAHPAVRVMETGEPLLLPEVQPELFERVARDDEHLRALRSMGVRSLMVVPLSARGRTLGAVALAAAESGRRYGAQELEVAVELAHRAALAVDNARLYREVQAANQAKADFLATMSHELRTPLNAVIGYADLMKMGITEGDPARAEEYAERIGLSARHLTQLIEEILTFSRLEAGSDTLSPAPLLLGDVIDEIRAIADPLAREKGLRLIVRESAAPIRMTSDPGKLRQVLLNLVSNAIKFTEQGEIEVAARQEGDRVVVEVRDTGIGITPQNQERIFEPFWQVEQGTTRQAGGTGLGLSVTRSLMDRMGGEIRVRSVPGEGSTFTVSLPLHLAPDPERTEGGEAEPARG